MVTLFGLNFDMPKFPRPSTTPAFLQLQAQGTMQWGGSILLDSSMPLWIGNPSSKLSTLSVCYARHTQSRSKDYASRSQRDHIKSSLDTDHSFNGKSNRT